MLATEASALPVSTAGQGEAVLPGTGGQRRSWEAAAVLLVGKAWESPRETISNGEVTLGSVSLPETQW